MWKILTAHLREEIYYSCGCRELFPEEQRMPKGTRGSDGSLYKDQHICREIKTRQKHVVMAYEFTAKVLWQKSHKHRWLKVKNVRNMGQSHKLYHESQGLDWKSGINRRINSWGSKNPKSHFPWRLTPAIAFCYSNDAS